MTEVQPERRIRITYRHTRLVRTGVVRDLGDPDWVWLDLDPLGSGPRYGFAKIARSRFEDPEWMKVEPL